MKRIAVCGETYSSNLGDQAIHNRSGRLPGWWSVSMQALSNASPLANRVSGSWMIIGSRLLFCAQPGDDPLAQSMEAV
ncbi:MAG: hypothetical protein ROW52_06290 [Anaerolineaceae bacterium]